MAALSLQTILAKNSSKCLVYRVVAKWLLFQGEMKTVSALKASGKC